MLPVLPVQNQDQRILLFEQGGNLSIAIESFLVDREAAGLAKRSVEFYAMRLCHFLAYCDSLAVKKVDDISPDFLRRYFLLLQEIHNPGGVHCMFRTLRAFFNWLDFEGVMPDAWKNPIKRVARNFGVKRQAIGQRLKKLQQPKDTESDGLSVT